MNTIQMKKDGKIWIRNVARNYPFNWATEVEVFDFLYGFTRMIKPEKVLEIGTFEGDTAIAIGKALKENQLGHLVTLDIKDYGQEKNIADVGLTNFITCIKENPNEYVQNLIQEYDMIFIDDGHDYPEVIRDLENAHRLIKPLGFILGHDVLAQAGVNIAYTNFTNRYKDQYHKIIVNSYDGVFILKKI